jgi:hypothetical protein
VHYDVWLDGFDVHAYEEADHSLDCMPACCLDSTCYGIAFESSEATQCYKYTHVPEKLRKLDGGRRLGNGHWLQALPNRWSIFMKTDMEAAALLHHRLPYTAAGRLAAQSGGGHGSSSSSSSSSSVEVPEKRRIRIRSESPNVVVSSAAAAGAGAERGVLGEKNGSSSVKPDLSVLRESSLSYPASRVLPVPQRVTTRVANAFMTLFPLAGAGVIVWLYATNRNAVGMASSKHMMSPVSSCLRSVGHLFSCRPGAPAEAETHLLLTREDKLQGDQLKRDELKTFPDLDVS